MPLYETQAAPGCGAHASRRPGARQMARIIGALAFAAVLTACSTVRLGYEQLPTLAYWWLDRYLDFNGTQTLQVREALAQWQAAHRREELPRLQQLLAEAQTLAAGDISADQACRFASTVRERLRAAAALAEAPAARIALSLGPSQTDALAARYARVNDEYRREWLQPSREAQLTRRFDTQRKRYEDFYGRLDDAQRAQLRTALAHSAFDAALTDAERRRRQAQILQLLRGWQQAPVSESTARAALASYLDRIAQAPPGPWRAQQQLLWQEGCATFSALHALTTPAQRLRAIERLQGYANDVAALQRTEVGMVGTD